MQQEVEGKNRLKLDSIVTLEQQKKNLLEAGIPDTKIEIYEKLDESERAILYLLKRHIDAFNTILEAYETPKDTDGGRRRRRKTKRNLKSRKSRKSRRSRRV
jgi:formiminotetrahydrofolate cyclodeaminase